MIPPLEAIALSRLQALVNSALELDPGTVQSLRPLAGKRLVIVSTVPRRTLAIHFLASGRIALSGDPESRADVSLTGTPVALAVLLAGAAQRSSFAGTGVTIDGDQALLQAIAAICEELDIDWEQALAGILGDTAAHVLAAAVRRSLKWQWEAVARAASGLGEYVREESGITVGNVEAESWYRAVRDLARDTDRLSARIDRLSVRLDDGQ